MLAAKVFVCTMLVVLAVGTAAEAAKDEPCDVRLGKSILYEKIVEKGRLDSERALAAERLNVEFLKAQIADLQKELAELKKPKEEKK